MSQCIVLASASPRRAQLLGQLGIDFEIVPARVDETLPAGMHPRRAALYLARIKALDVAARLPGRTVLAADTLVALRGRILGKPADAEHAQAMLRRLSGRRHDVYTGLCIARGTQVLTDCQRTRVWFGRVSESAIGAYTATADPLDKAGAYGIQGFAGSFVRRIDGCYYNVMGLPLWALSELLRRADRMD